MGNIRPWYVVGIAEHIVHGSARILPMEPYRPDRFEDGGEFRKAYAGTGAMA